MWTGGCGDALCVFVNSILKSPLLWPLFLLYFTIKQRCTSRRFVNQQCWRESLCGVPLFCYILRQNRGHRRGNFMVFYAMKKLPVARNKNYRFLLQALSTLSRVFVSLKQLLLWPLFCHILRQNRGTPQWYSLYINIKQNRLYCGLYFVTFCVKIEAHLKAIYRFWTMKESSCGVPLNCSESDV